MRARWPPPRRLCCAYVSVGLPRVPTRSMGCLYASFLDRLRVSMLASRKTLASKNAACSRLSIVRFATGPKRSMGHFLGAEKAFFLIRGRRSAVAVAAAAVESCQSVALRSPWGQFGSILYTCNRLHRIRCRFKHFWPISLSRPCPRGGPSSSPPVEEKLAKGVPEPGLPLQVRNWTRGVPPPG